MALPGEAHPKAKLTAAKVRAIRRLYWVKQVNQTCLARMYGVSVSAIHDAVNYVTWIHLKDTFTNDQIKRRRKYESV